MKQYMRLRPFKAISFDLDDTLYHNGLFIKVATQASFAQLQQTHTKTAAWTTQDWQQVKKRVLLLQPELMHDTSAVRYAMVRQGLIELGYSEHEASDGAQQTLACFQFHRSDFSVSQEILSLLNTLSKKFPIIGISNGNVDAKRIGLADALTFVLHPGQGVKMKPFADMYHLACQKLDIPASQLLHVGDHLQADVAGARMAGCQSVWFNPTELSQENSYQPMLPHIEITQLSSLLMLG
jgi:HAD superfamily hydrolase (TIGR01549 family)